MSGQMVNGVHVKTLEQWYKACFHQD